MLEDALELGEIQGNGIVGFNKPFMTFVYLRVQDVAAARFWLRDLAPEITTADVAHDAKMAVRRLRAVRFGIEMFIGPAVVNIAISATLLRALGFAPEALKGTSFVNGLEMQSPFLGDPVGVSPERLVVGWWETALDLLICS